MGARALSSESTKKRYPCRWDAARGGVRRANKAELLEVGDDVADGGRDRARPDSRDSEREPTAGRRGCSCRRAPAAAAVRARKVHRRGFVHGRTYLSRNLRVKKPPARHSTVFDVIQCIGRLCAHATKQHGSTGASLRANRPIQRPARCRVRFDSPAASQAARGPRVFARFRPLDGADDLVVRVPRRKSPSASIWSSPSAATAPFICRAPGRAQKACR
jgi:hypothetical protein